MHNRQMRTKRRLGLLWNHSRFHLLCYIIWPTIHTVTALPCMLRSPLYYKTEIDISTSQSPTMYNRQRRAKPRLGLPWNRNCCHCFWYTIWPTNHCTLSTLTKLSLDGKNHNKQLACLYCLYVCMVLLHDGGSWNAYTTEQNLIFRLQENQYWCEHNKNVTLWSLSYLYCWAVCGTRSLYRKFVELNKFCFLTQEYQNPRLYQHSVWCCYITMNPETNTHLKIIWPYKLSVYRKPKLFRTWQKQVAFWLLKFFIIKPLWNKFIIWHIFGLNKFC
jgi:hypothetical protein